MIRDRDFNDYQLEIYNSHLENFVQNLSKHVNDLRPEDNSLHFANEFLKYAGRTLAYKEKLIKLIDDFDEISREQRKRLKRKLIGRKEVSHTAELIELLVKTDKAAKLYEEMFKS